MTPAGSEPAGATLCDHRGHQPREAGRAPLRKVHRMEWYQRLRAAAVNIFGVTAAIFSAPKIPAWHVFPALAFVKRAWAENLRSAAAAKITARATTPVDPAG